MRDPHVAPAGRGLPQPGVDIGDVDAAGEGAAAVDDGDLAVVALVEPGDTPGEGGRVEGAAVHPDPDHLPEEGGGGIEGADVVVQEVDLDPAPGGGDQRIGHQPPGFVVAHRVELHADAGARLGDAVQKRREKLRPVAVQRSLVSHEGDRRRIAPEEVEELRRTEQQLLSLVAHDGHGQLFAGMGAG